MRYKYLSTRCPLFSPEQLLLRLLTPLNQAEIDRNVMNVVAYIGKKIENAEHVHERVKEFTDYIKKTISLNPSNEFFKLESENLHFVFLSILKLIVPEDVFSCIHPTYLTLAPYFSERDRDLLHCKPYVWLGSERLYLRSTQELGGGSFGYVKDAVLNHEIVAVKRVKLGDVKKYDVDDLLQAARESWIISQLKHKHIVMYKGRFMYSDGKSEPLCPDLGDSELQAMLFNLNLRDKNILKFAMVYELLTPLSTEVVYNFHWKESIRMLYEVSQGLSWMHEEGWMHGDFKLWNIGKSSNGSFKLFDMGLALNLKKDQCMELEAVPYDLTSIGGTYPSPEAIHIRASYFRVVTPSDDIMIPVRERGGDRVGYFAIRNLSPQLLQRIDTFAFAATMVDVLCPYFSREFKMDSPYYRIENHDNYNFRDSLIVVKDDPTIEVHPVFDFLSKTSDYLNNFRDKFSEYQWVYELIRKGLMLENKPMYMPEITRELQRQYNLLSVKSDGWVVV